MINKTLVSSTLSAMQSRTDSRVVVTGAGVFGADDALIAKLNKEFAIHQRRVEETGMLMTDDNTFHLNILERSEPVVDLNPTTKDGWYNKFNKRNKRKNFKG